LKKWKRALICLLTVLLAFSGAASASGLNLSGLDALMSKKMEGAQSGGKAAQIAQLTGGKQEIPVGVVAEGLAHYSENEDGTPSGFDVELAHAMLNKAGYRNHSFMLVENAEKAVSMLDSGEIVMILGHNMPDTLVSRVKIQEKKDSVAEADAALDMQAEGVEQEEAEHEEKKFAQVQSRYLRTVSYLSGKEEETLLTGESVNLDLREFYLIALAENAEVVSAFDGAFEKADTDGTKDRLWKEIFKTTFFYNVWRSIRRTVLGIWRQFRLNLIEEARYTMIFTGLGRTLLIAVCAAFLGVLFGCVIALMRLSNIKIGSWYVLRSISTLYVDVIRGTPVVVQLMIMYYIILNSPGISKITVAILTFGLNSAAYVSEMVRGGILAVDKGQTEAGRSLGLSSSATMLLIILPQTIKIIIPSLFNEIIMLLKETSVVGFIGLMDLTKAGDYIRSRTYSAFFPLLTVACVYLVIVTVLTRVFDRVERRMRQSDIR